MGKIPKTLALILSLICLSSALTSAQRTLGVWNWNDEFLQAWSAKDRGSWPFADRITAQNQLSLRPSISLLKRPSQNYGQIQAQALGQWQELQFSTDLQFNVLQTSSHKDIFSPDGEFVEFNTTQSEDLKYQGVTYSRLRALAAYTSGLGQWMVGRDVIHWGPSYRNALVLNRSMVPLVFGSWTLSFEKVQMSSLLSTVSDDGSGGAFNSGLPQKTLQGHRIEWQPWPTLNLGFSEVLLSQKEWPKLAILPFVPLFAEKGQGVEDENNGNLAVDFNWRVIPTAKIYGEFMVDDFESPQTLLNDHWKSKWAATLGANYSKQLNAGSWGVLGEWTRIEPWVYSHHRPGGPRYSNKSISLGSDLGPGRISWLCMPYLNTAYGSWQSQFQWVGRDRGRGSELFQIHSDSIDGLIKDFPQHLSWRAWWQNEFNLHLWHQNLSLRGVYTVGDSSYWELGLQWRAPLWQFEPGNKQ